MTKFTTVYNNFSGGKVTEKFKGRFDTKEYTNSLEENKNMFPERIGGSFKRCGTSQISDMTSILASTSADFYKPLYKTIPFEAGDGESYSIFVTAHTITLQNYLTYLHIFRNDRTKAATVYNTVTNITSNQTGPNWTPNTSSLSTSGGINAWKFCQVGDLLFLTHASGEQRPLVLVRLEEDKFELNYADQFMTNSAGIPDHHKLPFASPNVTGTNLTLVGSTLTASSALFQNSMPVSQTFYKIESGALTRVVRVDTFTSSTSVTVTNVIGFGDIVATDDWQESAWRNPTNSSLSIEGNGWPTSVAYQNSKIIWGGNLKFPDTIWASLTFNLFHLDAIRLTQDATTDVSGVNYFGDAVLGVDPFSLIVGSTESNNIRWITGGRVLTIGTSGGEYLIPGIGTDAMEIKPNSNYGSSSYPAIRMGKDIVFVGATRRNLRTYRYSEDNGSWVSDDLTSKLDNFNDGSYFSSPYSKYILDFVWNSENKLLFVATNSGAYVLGHDAEYGINGWSDLSLGVEEGHTAKILSFTSLKTSIGGNEEIFMLVQRFDGVSTYKYYIEKLTIPYYESTVKFVPPNYSSTTGYYDSMDRMPRFLDLAIHQQANGSGIVTGMDVALIGRTVTATWFNASVFDHASEIDIITDGAGGSKLDYTFPNDVYVIFGYYYSANIKTLPPEAGGQFGTSLADIKTIHESYLKLYRTKDFSIGSIDKQSGNELSFEDFTYDDLETNDQRVQVSDNPDTDGQIIIRSTTPTPFNVLALINKGVSYD